MRIHLQVAIGAAALMLAVTGSAVAQQSSGAQPVLAMTAYSVAADGSTVASAGGDDPLVAGNAVTHYLYAGKAGQEGLCSSGSADGSVTDLGTLLGRAAHVWKVTATGVKYEGGKQTFDFEWARYASASGTVPVVSRKQRLTLAQDQAYTVDLLHNSSSDCRTASIVVEIAAGVREDPALANTVLHYDVWLVRRDASGKKETRQFVLTGKQGAAVPFAFAPLVGEVPALQPNQYDFSVLTHVSGELRGRIGANGRLSLELNTRRQDRLYHPAQDPSSNPGLGAGRKVLDVGEGEAVEIELPARSGYSAHYASAADAAQGQGTMSRIGAGQGAPASSLPAVSLQSGRVVVSFGPYFTNERVSLIVQARKAE